MVGSLGGGGREDIGVEVIVRRLVFLVAWRYEDRLSRGSH